MKLMIINPDWGMTKEQMDVRCRILSEYAGPDVEISMECLTKTRVNLNSMVDIVLAGPEILEMTASAEQRGYDAVILYCFSDPVMEACRQMVSIPVVGAGQAACLMLPLVGYHGAVLVADEGRIPEKKVSIGRTGLSPERICGYEAVRTGRADVSNDRMNLKNSLLDAGRRALEKTDAQVLILGCLSFMGLARELEEELSVPVIDPGPASVCLAEALVRQGLRPGRKAYQYYKHEQV